MTKALKSTFQVFMLLILVNSLVLVGTVAVSAQVPGVIIIIGSDTTWTKADSPHTLTGPVLVNQGATLTIEAGATVNLNGYEFRVNGTLRAIGTSADQILFENGTVTFTKYSSAWNEQTGSGCLIENAVIKNTLYINGSLKLSNSEVSTIVVDGGGSPTIVNNLVRSTIRVNDGAPKILNNEISYYAALGGNECSPVISGNFIRYGIRDGAEVAGGSPVITNNVISEGDVSVGGVSAVISGNTLNGGGAKYDLGFRYNGVIGALEIGSSSAVISDNVIDGKGIYLIGNCDSLVIKNNTINSGIFCSQTSWEGERGTYNATSFEISGNTITGKMEVSTNFLSVSNNKIIGSAGTGIEFSVYGTEITSITNNTITGFFNGISGSNPEGVLIEKNFITNNMQGIRCTDNHVVIQNNTITNNTIGIYEGSSSTIIRYNNIENNTEHSIYLETTSDNIDASNNWWGTNDQQTINVTIRDHKYDFDVGTVSFTPFLTEPNPEATPNEIPEFSEMVLFPLFVTATLVAVYVRKQFTRF